MKKDSYIVPQAPPQNRANVYRCPFDLDANTVVYGGAGKPVSAEKTEEAVEGLFKFNREHDMLVRHILDEEFDAIRLLEAGSLEELVDKSLEVIAQALEPVINDPNVEDKDKEDLLHAALSGCGVTVAFLDVVARMQAQGRNAAFDAEVYKEIVAESFSYIVQPVSRTSREADATLTASMMNWTREQARRLQDLGDKEYFGLLFDRTFFHMDNDTVMFKDDKAARKRIRDSVGNVLDTSPNNDNYFFGCPFAPDIRRLWQAMADTMIKNGLAEQSYNRALSVKQKNDYNKIKDWRWTA